MQVVCLWVVQWVGQSSGSYCGVEFVRTCMYEASPTNSLTACVKKLLNILLDLQLMLLNLFPNGMRENSPREGC